MGLDLAGDGQHRVGRYGEAEARPRRAWRWHLCRPPPGRRAGQPGAERGAPGTGRAGGPAPRGLGRRRPAPVGAALGRSSLRRAALGWHAWEAGPGGSHDHPRPRQSRGCVRAELSWRASTRSPGAAAAPGARLLGRRGQPGRHGRLGKLGRAIGSALVVLTVITGFCVCQLSAPSGSLQKAWLHAHTLEHVGRTGRRGLQTGSSVGANHIGTLVMQARPDPRFASCLGPGPR